MFKSKKRQFNKILRDIKSIKIQGARNIAKAALRSYSLFPTKQSKKMLLSLRPTEPMLQKVISLAGNVPILEIQNHFDFAQEKINKQVFRLIKSQDIIFTHCHSTNVVNALIYAKNKGKKFEVYNTETRPLYQGRKTSRELKKAGIPVTQFVDSAVSVALSGEQGIKKVSKVFLGADAITKKGIINKIGSEVIAQIAKNQKIPVYIIADSWKFTKKNLSFEQRKLNEVWNNAPKNIKIKNPAFEFVDKKYIKAIVSEFGVLSFKDLLKRV